MSVLWALLVLALPIECPEGEGPFAAAPNYCSTLVPTPDLEGVTATLSLTAPSGPFAVPMTRDGVADYAMAITASGLPPATSLGPYTVYIAWATSLTLDSVVKLGVVRNGRTLLGPVGRNQIRVIVSAERSASVAARTGRLVLRGTSPSVRLLAHRDLMTPFAPGAATSVSMSSMSSMPSMSGMTPVAASLPPEARPSTVVALRDGDTLSLVATFVRRSVAGRSFVAYGYNGEYPGPRLEVQQGTAIVVRFENRTDQPTTVHWHGLRLDNPSDGAAGLTQDVVPVGGQFVYHVRFPDAGIFWYHAHEREDMQQHLGLFGSILVAPRVTEPVRVNDQVVLTIQDLLVGSDGPMPFGVDTPTHALMGRFGNAFLVNGTTRFVRSVHRRAIVRFLITNVSNARPYNLVFGDARMKVIASDLGPFEHEAWVPSIVIAPAERYVVDVRFMRAGDVAITSRIQALDHRFGTFTPEVDTLGVIHVDSQVVTPDYSVDFARLRAHVELEPYRAYFDRPVDHTVRLEMRVHDLPASIANMFTGASVPVDMNDGMAGMNALTTGREITWVLRDPATGAENMDIRWRFARGTFAKIRIYNDPVGPHPMAHPIHVHGERMVVLSRNGVVSANLVWKDTVLIPAGETVDVLLDLANPGHWMLHCHIAEHRAAGMMMALDVDP